MSHDLYDNYFEWKKWTDLFHYSPLEDGYYSAETAGIDLNGADVLEIGFGTGSFLAWARDKGAKVHGLEINRQSIEAAQAAGVPLLPTDFETAGALAPDSFDIIVAFDVFEHMSVDELIAKLAAIDRALRPQGLLILRYPNTQSPFGLMFQNSDATHKVMLSMPKIEQYAAGTALKTVTYRGASLPDDGSLKRRIINLSRRTAMALMVKYMHIALATDTEFAPNVLHIMRKEKSG